MATKQTYTDEQHTANRNMFDSLMSQNKPIPDELYVWFNGAGGRWYMELSETLYANAYHYLINHNDKAIADVSSEPE